ncbi:MAG: hypothetical protein ACT4O5_16485 [Gammaproteobacteria bacterium]
MKRLQRLYVLTTMLLFALAAGQTSLASQSSACIEAGSALAGRPVTANGQGPSAGPIAQGAIKKQIALALDGYEEAANAATIYLVNEGCVSEAESLSKFVAGKYGLAAAARALADYYSSLSLRPREHFLAARAPAGTWEISREKAYIWYGVASHFGDTYATSQSVAETAPRDVAQKEKLDTRIAALLQEISAISAKLK